MMKRMKDLKNMPMRINESKFQTVGPCLSGIDEKEAIEYLNGYDFDEEYPEEQEIKYADFIDTANGISLFYDYVGDYYFFAIADKNRDDFNKKLVSGEYYTKESNNNKNMKKNVQRINESQLRAIVAESVKNILNEFDEPFPYNYTDAREREDYFERAVKADFPSKYRNGRIGRSWEGTYYGYKEEQMDLEKERRKKDKILKAQEKERLKQDKEIERKQKQKTDQALYFDAVMYTIHGDDALVDVDLNGNLDDYMSIVSSENPQGAAGNWYDGVARIPLAIKEGENIKKVAAHIDSISENDDKTYEYGKYEDGQYVFSGSWGVTWGDNDDDFATISYRVSINLYNKSMTFKLTNSDNPRVVTQYSSFITKYLNGVVYRNYLKLKKAGYVPKSDIL